MAFGDMVLEDMVLEDTAGDMAFLSEQGQASYHGNR